MNSIARLFKRYFLNCFVLMLPVLIWNIIFSSKLPENYQPEVFLRDIPDFITYGENASRLVLFVIAYLMPLHISTKREQIGLSIYLAGLLLYFVSWSILIYFPKSIWSTTVVGFSAPAYLPAIWIAGISLLGNSFYFNLPFRRWIFITAAIIFLAFHISHTIMVYDALN